MKTVDNTTSLVPIQNQGIAKVEKSILITNKILSQQREWERYYYDWWNNLSEVWKKIFNAHIGKIEKNSGGSVANHIYEKGVIDLPNKEELRLIINISKIDYTENGYEYINNYPIDDISPLTELKKLESLYIYNNNVFDLSPIRHLAMLKNLGCANNQIKSLEPIIECKELASLHCRNNLITSLEPLRYLKKIEYLVCSGNPIIDFSPLSDLKNMRHLTYK